MPDVEQQCFYTVNFGETEEMYKDIYPTTWREMLNRGWLEDMSTFQTTKYRFTSYGWLAAVCFLDLPNKPEFRNRMGLLAATLKGFLNGRNEDVFTRAEDIHAKSGLEIGFIENAIDSDLLGVCFDVRGAEWVRETLLTIRIPLDFGLKRL
jgi:hypothetical protein